MIDAVLPTPTATHTLPLNAIPYTVLNMADVPETLLQDDPSVSVDTMIDADGPVPPTNHRELDVTQTHANAAVKNDVEVETSVQLEAV
jgi:hypothetical protein